MWARFSPFPPSDRDVEAGRGRCPTPPAPQTLSCLAGGCSWDQPWPAVCPAGELEVEAALGGGHAAPRCLPQGAWLPDGPWGPGDAAWRGAGQGNVPQLGSR